MHPLRLDSLSTRAPENAPGKHEGKNQLLPLLEKISQLQNLMMAEGKHALLVIIQGMDASGKDGLIRKVFGAMNPMGIRVQGFKVPTEEEFAHDFLWRIHKHTPGKGQVVVFNRSHYEDVIVPAIREALSEEAWMQRAQAINDFERLLIRHGNTAILKIFLHVSHEEQQSRLQERMQVPEKMWKYNANDLVESKKWPRYMATYEKIFATCNEVPWHIIPADQNWYKELLVAQKLVSLLEGLEMKFPGLKTG